jgi:hypothetical protein
MPKSYKPQTTAATISGIKAQDGTGYVQEWLIEVARG